jgi:hypothetical protein
MHTDDDERVAIFLLEPAQLGDDVHAVDATVGPEVEQDDFAAQLFQRQRPRDVQPVNGPVSSGAWMRSSGTDRA